jgi:hypothetical protein
MSAPDESLVRLCVQSFVSNAEAEARKARVREASLCLGVDEAKLDAALAACDVKVEGLFPDGVVDTYTADALEAVETVRRHRCAKLRDRSIPTPLRDAVIALCTGFGVVHGENELEVIAEHPLGMHHRRCKRARTEDLEKQVMELMRKVTDEDGCTALDIAKWLRHAVSTKEIE